MARYKCPCCGAAYNGTKCRSCYYERFTEEIAHGNHTHEGEPLVVKDPVRKPIPRKDPFACEKNTRKKRSSSYRKPARKKHPILRFLIILAAIYSVIPMLVEWGQELASKKEEATPEPMYEWNEEIEVPKDVYVLYEDEEIRFTAQWQDGQEFGDGFSYYLENNSDREVYIFSKYLVVNGCQMDLTSLGCSTEPGTTEARTFWLDEQDVAATGIRDVQEISFQLEIVDMDNFDTIATTDTITLTASVPEDAVLFDIAEGTTIFDQDGIQVRYLGYMADSYYPEDFSEGTLLFYIENNTQRDLNVSSIDMFVNGEEADIFLWRQLPANTRTVANVYLYCTEDMGIDSLEDLGTLEFRLEISDQSDYEWDITSDPISISAAQ